MDAAELAGIVKEVRVMRLGPRDRVVFKCKPLLSEGARHALRAAFEKTLPGVKIIVLDGDAELEVLRED